MAKDPYKLGLGRGINIPDVPWSDDYAPDTPGAPPPSSDFPPSPKGPSPSASSTLSPGDIADAAYPTVLLAFGTGIPVLQIEEIAAYAGISPDEMSPSVLANALAAGLILAGPDVELTDPAGFDAQGMEIGEDELLHRLTTGQNLERTRIAFRPAAGVPRPPRR